MEQTWTRDYFAEDEGEMVPRTSHAAAFLSDTKDRGPPVQSQIWRSGEKAFFGQTPSLRAFEKPPQVQTQALRDFEKHLNDLKKENFSLKLRIYFLEERMQQKYEASREDIYKRNIELKVEVESLKRELQDKKQHLDKTWADVENLNSHNEAELRRQFEERQQETEHVYELLENKIQLLQEESRLAKNEAARMAALVEAEKECNLELSEKLKGVANDREEVPMDQVNPDQYTDALAQRDKRIEELHQSLASQEKLVEQLSQEKQQLLHLLEEPVSMEIQGSRFYGNELKKEKQVNQRIENMMQQKAQITSQQLRKAQLQVDRYAMELEQSRDLNNTIVHIDMDAFYAAVEMRDNPELKDKPIAVGSMSMLSTSNYYARRFGVRAAMPGFIAKRLCPQLIIVPPNFDKYRAVSTEVKEILADYDPNFLAMSLDEAYLNITKHLQERQNWPEDKRKYFIKTEDKPRKEVNKLREHERSISPLLFDDSPPDMQSQGNPLQGNSEEEDNPQTLQNSIVFGTSAEEVVKEIRFRIEQKTTLTASAGIAPNTMLAKVCSDKNKPNGQYQVLPNRQAVMDFIKDLPIRKVSGIGKVTEKMLKALGIITCTELYQQRALLSLLFSETSWHHFLHISLGLGSTHLARDGERKSMSVERTFSEISKAEEQYNLCQELCSELAQDLQKEGLKGRTVTIKLKNVNFEVKTRASTVSSVVSTTEEIFAIAKELLRTEIDADFPHPLRLRLMGVRLSSFPNEEDKRHQQRSIIGFLQAGNQSQSAPRCILENTDKDQFLKSLEMSHKKSFFDKKRSERKWSHQDTFKCEAVDKQSLQTSHSFQVLKKKMNENLETSENSNNSQIFTCPICFREQRSISLEAFNKHVDACLDGPSISGTSNMFSHSHVSSTEVNKKENVYPSFSQSEKQDYETHQRNSEINFIELPETEDNPAKAESVDALSDKHRKEECASLPSKPFNIEKCCQNSSSTVSLEDIASLSRQESSQPYLQALVCPVCNLEQKTSDLTLFNVHVDVCLNKGIIQELRKDKVNLANQPRENTKSTDNSGRVQKTATKPKRPGLMTKYSASKKTKPNNSRHTLDVFFK